AAAAPPGAGPLDPLDQPVLASLPAPLETRVPLNGLPPAAVWHLLAPFVKRLARALATGVRDSLEDFLEHTLPALGPGYLLIAPSEPRLFVIGWTVADTGSLLSPGLFAELPPEWTPVRPSIEALTASGVVHRAHAASGSGPVGDYIQWLRRSAAEQAGYTLAAAALWLVRGRPPFEDRKAGVDGWAFRAARKIRAAVLPKKPFLDMPQFAALLKRLLSPQPDQRAIPDSEALWKAWEQAAPGGVALEKLRACVHCGSLMFPDDRPCWLCRRAQRNEAPESGLRPVPGERSARHDLPDNLGSGRRRVRAGRLVRPQPGIRFYCLACHAPLHAALPRAGTLGRCPLCSSFNEIPRTSSRASGPGHEVYLDPPVQPDPDAAPRVFVPAGPFAAGVEAISVILPAFAIDALPVTNAQYARFFRQFQDSRRHRSQPKVPFPPHIEDILDPDKANLPVVGLTYPQAEYYAHLHGGRMPTALEWERCARGPEGRRFAWGDDFNPLYCNHRRYADAVAQLGADPGHLPVIREPELLPVGAIERDAGFSNFHDAAGNVAEWTSNRREIYDGRLALREVRGGCYLDGAEFLLETWANMWQPENQPEHWIGFRVAYDVL
ncbi:MAG: formylglycine-generating enzyme family protein, partial [Planctomycetota bacterium]